MYKIVIFDDREDLRNTISHMVDLASPDNWMSVALPPFPDQDDYIRYINENDVSVLILDERLHEQANDSAPHVDYNGHDVAARIRKYIPEFPIHIITSHKDDSDLQDNRADLDSIYNREEFIGEPEKVVPVIIRSAQRFLDTHRANLDRFTKLSEKLAARRNSRRRTGTALCLEARIKYKVQSYWRY